MALAANPKEYLARLDKNLEVIELTPTQSAPTETRSTTTVIDPTTGAVTYVDNSQFYMTMFFALALVLMIIYLLERKKG